MRCWLLSYQLMQASSLKLCPFPLHTHYISFHSSINFTTWTGADTRRETEYSLDRTPFIRYLMYNTETCNICPFIQLATQISISETWPWTAAANCRSKQPLYVKLRWNHDYFETASSCNSHNCIFLALVLWLYFSAPEVIACLMFDSLHSSSLEAGAFAGMDLVSTTNHNQLQPHLEVFV